MNTRATLLLAGILAAGSAFAGPGVQEYNARNPNDSRAFDVMDTDQGPPTAADREYAKPKHKKHKKHKMTETQPADVSSMGDSGATGATGSGAELRDPPPVSQDIRTLPDYEPAPDQPRVENK
jgi:hypothetical protein